MEMWEIAILAAAGYLAVATLVRLMLARRDRLLADFRTQMAQARRKKKQTKKPAAEKPPSEKAA